MRWKGKINFEERPEHVGNKILSEISGEFNALSEKTSAADDDLLIIEDSENSFTKAKMKLSTLNDVVSGGAGTGDVTAASTLGDNNVIRGDGGGKGIQDSLWLITDSGILSAGFSHDDYILDVHNTRTTGPSGGRGFRIMAGEVAGDIVFHIADADDTFQIMEMEADQGHIVIGETFENTVNLRGVAYGVDIQHAGVASDFNTQSGRYRIGGQLMMMGTYYQDAASEGESSTTAGTYQQKLRLTTPSLPSGEYRISWSFEMDGQGDNADAQVELNDTTQIGFNFYDSSINGYIQVSGFYYDTLSGVNTIDIDYRDLQAAACLIRRARLEIWRVS